VQSRTPDIRLIICCFSSGLLCLPLACRGEAGVELDCRMYLMMSGYYDGWEDDAVANPKNVLEYERAGLLYEINTQSKMRYRDDYLLAVDASYQYASGATNENETDTHFNTNEIYADLFLNQRVYVKAGKKRESWSVGTVFYPVDIVNPPMNPLDPSKSREGVYLAALEIPFGVSSLSFAYYPHVEYGPDDRDGIPGRMDLGEGDLGMRAYSLVAETDVAFVYYRAERIPSLAKSYYGLTLNRFFGYFGTYVEVLGHRGRDVELLRKDAHAVVYDFPGFYYFPDQDERVELGRADEDVYVDFAAGASYTFSDNTRIGVEYLRNSEGYDDREFDQLHTFLTEGWRDYTALGNGRMKADLLQGVGMLRGRIRRDYLAFRFDRPNTLDDLLPRLNVVVSLDDGSFAVGGLVDCLIREDTSLKLVVTSPFGEADTEYGLNPEGYRATFEIKWYW
jgi:hypothetical protein